MKYVLLGTLSADWAARQSKRVKAAKAKLKDLKITLVSVHYTQGPYDFVVVIEAPDAEAVLAFSVWYAANGYGRMTSMPAFDDKTMKKAVGRIG